MQYRIRPYPNIQPPSDEMLQELQKVHASLVAAGRYCVFDPL
jgi:hypothetical protein